MKSTKSAEKPVVITRTFPVPAAKVWEAWTEPEQMKQWWGPKNYSCPHCEIDFRIGGKYLASMRGEDGREIFSTGTYREIVPARKIVYTDNFSDAKGNVISPEEAGMPGEWREEMEVTLDLEEEHGETTMKLTHTGIPDEMHEDCITGWDESVDKLERMLAAKGRTTL